MYVNGDNWPLASSTMQLQRDILLQLKKSSNTAHWTAKHLFLIRLMYISPFIVNEQDWLGWGCLS